MQRVIPALTRIVKPGRVYLGVGPEQNFTYIAAIQPAMAFIIDIRRGNLQLHLMYKALFEMSVDRADFVSRLFSLKRPAGLDRKSTVQTSSPRSPTRVLRSPELYKQNVSAIRRLLTERTNWSCLRRTSKASKTSTRRSTSAGSASTTRCTGSAGSFPTYAELMVATDETSVPPELPRDRRELRRDQGPAQPKPGRAGRRKLRGAQGHSGGRQIPEGTQCRRPAFYVSNVEQYLIREGGLDEFCASVASLPLDDVEHVHQKRARRAPVARRRRHSTRRLRLWREFQLQAGRHAGIREGVHEVELAAQATSAETPFSSRQSS